MAPSQIQPYEAVFGQKAVANERLLDMLADQGLLNEEDIDPELIEQPVADVTDSSCDVELPSSQPLAEATTPETTSAGIATNSTSPALLCQPPVFPASASRPCLTAPDRGDKPS